VVKIIGQQFAVKCDPGDVASVMKTQKWISCEINIRRQLNAPDGSVFEVTVVWLGSDRFTDFAAMNFTQRTRVLNFFKPRRRRFSSRGGRCETFENAIMRWADFFARV